MRHQGPKKSMQFSGTILTDGMAAFIVKQNCDTTKDGTSKKFSIKIKEDINYIENISKEELEYITGKCVFFAPGRQYLLYCMHEKSTSKKKDDIQIYTEPKSTRNQVYQN